MPPISNPTDDLAPGVDQMSPDTVTVPDDHRSDDPAPLSTMEDDDPVAALLADEDISGAPPRQRRRRRPRLRGFWRRHRFLSLLAAVFALFLVVAGWSWYRTISEPGQNDTLAVRTVEWLRDNKMGWAVNGVERWWYTSFGKPKEGGDPTHDIQIAGSSDVTTAPGETTTEAPNAPKHLEPPKAVQTPADSPLAGEGEWQPIGPQTGGIPGMYATQIRPDATHTSVLGLVVWMDPNLVRFQLHPGTAEPGGSWATPPLVPEDQRADLVAAFNSGFKMSESKGGFYSEGREAKPLVNGQGTLVIRNDGTATVGEWGRDLQMGPDVASARQNLALIVDNGQPAPGLESDSGGKWGATLGGDVLVWRSAIGVTADGALVYVASDALTAPALADMLVRAGAVRAIELDINHAWTTFNTFAPDASGTVQGTKGLPDMMKSANRYLSADSRDFVAVFRRQL